MAIKFIGKTQLRFVCDVFGKVRIDILAANILSLYVDVYPLKVRILKLILFLK